jgi:hypothetical protein
MEIMECEVEKSDFLDAMKSNLAAESNFDYEENDSPRKSSA